MIEHMFIKNVYVIKKRKERDDFLLYISILHDFWKSLHDYFASRIVREIVNLENFALVERSELVDIDLFCLKERKTRSR